MKILNLLNEISYDKYVNAAVDDIAYDANATGFSAGAKHPAYNKSDENGTPREQKRKKGIKRALKLLARKKQD